MLIALVLEGLIVSGNTNLPVILQVMTPAYFHLFMLGWITQLIFGVAWWLFPLIPETRSKGNEKLGWVLYFLLNTGLILRVITEPQNTINPNGIWALLLAFSAIIQVIAGFIYVILLLPRVRPKTINIKKTEN